MYRVSFLYEKHNNDFSNKVPFSFGVDSSGNYGYKKAGADTVTPFKTVGTRSSNITANGTYTAISDINKDGYSSVTVNVTSNVQTKSVTAGTSNVIVTPDSGYVGMSKVTVAPTPTENKTATPSTSSQTITPSSGKHLSSVTVNAINTQSKSVTPSTSAQTVTPDSGKYLTAVSVGAISTQTKSATPTTSAQTITPDSGKYLTSVSVGAISTQTKEITATTGTQTVTPDSGKYLTSVKIKPQNHTSTFTASTISSSLDMGANHNYRYINTSGISGGGEVTELWTNTSKSQSSSFEISPDKSILSYDYVFIVTTYTGTSMPAPDDNCIISAGFDPNNLFYTEQTTAGTKYNFIYSLTFIWQGMVVSRFFRTCYFDSTTNKIYIGDINSSGGMGEDQNFVPWKVIGVKS